MESFEMIEKRESRIQGYMTTGLSYVEAERVMYEVDRKRTDAQMVREIGAVYGSVLFMLGVTIGAMWLSSRVLK
jgi:hypothetical protein